MTTQYNRIQELEIALEGLLECFDISQECITLEAEVATGEGTYIGEVTMVGDVIEAVKNAELVLYSEEFGSDWEEGEE